jgi:hypothetical protein
VEPTPFDAVREEERRRIRERRKNAELDEGNPAKDAIGVALSGGGVRSATFNLGLLQAFHKHDFLKKVDYLSTVSGGGYIGSSLSWFMSKGGSFPFPKASDDESARPLRWLRRHSSYLTPGDGLSSWALAAAVIRGMMINLIVFLPIFFALFYMLTWAPRQQSEALISRYSFIVSSVVMDIPLSSFLVVFGLTHLVLLCVTFLVFVLGSRWKPTGLDRHRNFSLLLIPLSAFLAVQASRLSDLGVPEEWSQTPFLWALFLAGTAMFVLLLVVSILYSLFSRWKPLEFDPHRQYSIRYGQLLKLSVLLGAFGILPLIHDALIDPRLAEWRPRILSSLSLTGVLTLAAGWRRKTEDETRGVRAFLLRIGLLLLVAAFMLWLFQFALYFHGLPPFKPFSGLSIPGGLLVVGGIVISMVVGRFSDINHVSMHRYYRDRLLEAYMPTLTEDEASFSGADRFFLKEVETSLRGAPPYQIINTNVTTMGSSNPKYRARGGDCFIFSPCFVGSEATGYFETEEYINGEMTLATAFSISGAAVDPNTGTTRSRPLSFIMTLLNARLGYWVRNPKYRALLKRDRLPPVWHYVGLREMLGWRMDEKREYIRLSDGGHFENLGFYELVRRECPYIIVSDASQDPKPMFQAISRASELVRADFGAEVDIDLQFVDPDKTTKYSSSPYVHGKIHYQETGKTGELFYLKTTMFDDPDLPIDVRGYKRANREFPDEPTTNQFFDETQFEAYRELGFRVGERFLTDCVKKLP